MVSSFAEFSETGIIDIDEIQAHGTLFVVFMFICFPADSSRHWGSRHCEVEKQ
jgi:hypothetical protein